MSLEKLGAERLREELKAGRPTLPVLRDLLKDYGTSNIAVFSGALSEAITLIGDAQAKGLKLSIGGRPIGGAAAICVELNRSMQQKDFMLLCEQVKIVAGGVDAIRGRINWSRTANTAENATAPVRVEVVSLPTRKTTSEVYRDLAGNIVASTQVERDAA
jgi:hypothetical protein